MSEDGSKTITFGKELDPSETVQYQEKIARAKQKGGVHSLKEPTPVGGIEKPRIPVLQRDGAGVSPINDTGGVQPRPPGSPPVRPETLQQIAEFAQAQAQQVRETKATPAAPVEEKEEIKDILDSFDFEGRTEAERILNNKKRRKEIEARCSEMKLEDLIMQDEVKQLVPIVPNGFEVVFRSMTPDENLYIKKLMAKETTQTDFYLLEKYSILQLTCCVASINGRDFPPHLKQNGDIDEDAFSQKLRMLLKKSAYVIADLGVNYMWFDLRVRRLLNPEKLGNG